jgi:hypothetical protein
MQRESSFILALSRCAIEHQNKTPNMKTVAIDAFRIFTDHKSEEGIWSHSLCNGESHITYTTILQFDTAGNVVGASGSFSDGKRCDGCCKVAHIPTSGYPFGDPETWIKTSMVEKLMIARMMGE